VKFIALRNIILLERVTVLEPGHAAIGAGVAERLEDVERVLIGEDAVGVIQDNHVAVLAIAIPELVELDRADGARHRLRDNVRGVLKDVAHRVGLAYAWGTRHHHAANVTLGATLRELAQHVETILEVGENLDIGASLDSRLRGALGEHLLGGTTTTLNLERHSSWDVCCVE